SGSRSVELHYVSKKKTRIPSRTFWIKDLKICDCIYKCCLQWQLPAPSFTLQRIFPGTYVQSIGSATLIKSRSQRQPEASHSIRKSKTISGCIRTTSLQW